MKRALAIFLSVTLLCLSGCAAAPEADASVSPAPVETEKPEKPESAEPTLSPFKQETALSSASDYLESRLKEYDSVLYVYKDFADGANYYTQKAWMGSDYKDVPMMREDAEGYDGSSSIACEIDLSKHSWGKQARHRTLESITLALTSRCFSADVLREGRNRRRTRGVFYGRPRPRRI